MGAAAYEARYAPTLANQMDGNTEDNIDRTYAYIYTTS